MRRGAEMPSPGQILSAVELLIEKANDLPDRMMNPGPSDWPDATRCSEEGECSWQSAPIPGSDPGAVLCDMGSANSLRRIEKLDFWKTPDSFDSKPWMRPGSGDYKMRVAKAEARRDYDLAAMLADVPMGESPIGGDCSVTTVVISDHGKGDRPDGKLGSKSPCWLGGNPVRSARGTSNSTGRSESEPKKPRNTSPIGSG